MEIIEIPRGNDYRITFSLSSGATGTTDVVFTMKLFSDVAQNDNNAIIAKAATFTLNSDALTGYVDLTDDETDVTEKAYKFDFKLKISGKYSNVSSGVIIIGERVTVREP